MYCVYNFCVYQIKEKKAKLKLYPSYWRMKNVCKQMKWYLLFKLFTVVLIYAFHRPTSLRFLKDWHIVLLCLCSKIYSFLLYSCKHIFQIVFHVFFFFLVFLKIMCLTKKAKRKRCNNLHWMSFKIFLLVGINLAENVYKINLSTDNRKIYVANFVLYVA